MKHLLLFLFTFNVYFLAAQSEQGCLPIGEYRILPSKILNEDRVLNIYLPPTYDAAKSYPVIYLLDGSLNEDFVHIAGLVQFFNMMHGMPDCIVVGISNVDRKRDFSFHTDLEDLKKKYPTTGHSDVFIQFIETELQPFIRQQYKTTEEQWLIGQSLGGLLASEILLKKPQLFSHYMIVSPSLWWDNKSMLKQADKLLAAQTARPKFVYVAVGKKEDKIMRRVAKKLYKSLEKHRKPDTKLHFQMMRDEDHATILHNCIYKGLLLIYRRQ